MAKYYPQPPIDWATTLEKIYARQSKQLEEHHANLRQRDNQMVDKINKDNFVDNLAKVAQFSTAAGSLVQSVKKSRAENEGKDRSAFGVKWAKNAFKEEEYKTLNDTYKLVKKEIIKGDVKTRDVIEKLRTQAKEEKNSGKLKLAEALENLSAKEQIFAQELIARKTIAASVNDSGFNAHLSETGGLNLEGNDRDAALKSWQLEQLSHLTLSNEFLTANVLGELDRKSSTARNLGIAKINAEYSSNKDLNFLEQLSTRSGDPESFASFADSTHSDLVQHFTENSQEGFTATQSATQTIANRFERLLMDEHITLDDVNSYLGYNIEHPAGDNVDKAYFSKEQVNELVAAGKIGAGRKQARNDAIVKKEAFDLRTKALTPGSFKSTEDYNAEIDSLVSRGLSTEDANNLKDIKLWAQTADHYTSTLKEYTPVKIANASLEEINKIPNEKAREVIRKRKLQLLESEKMYGISKGSMDSIIMNSTERAVPWKVGMEVKGTGISGEIAMEIDNQGEVLRAQLVWAQYDAEGNLVNPNTEINTIVSDYKMNLWKSKGGGTTDKDGLYSIDSTTNTFSNYIEQSRDIALLGQGSDYSVANQKTWDSDIATKYQGWDLNSGTPLLTKEDIQHAFLTGDMSDRMEYIMHRFPDIPRTSILQHSLDIYTKNKKNDFWTKPLSLKSPIVKFDGNGKKNQIAKESMLKGLDMAIAVLDQQPLGPIQADLKDAKELQTLLKIKGWGYLSDTQKQRILFYMIRNTEKMDQYGHQDWIKELQENQKKFETQLKDLNKGSDLPDDTTDTMNNYG